MNALDYLYYTRLHIYIHGCNWIQLDQYLCHIAWSNILVIPFYHILHFSALKTPRFYRHPRNMDSVFLLV